MKRALSRAWSLFKGFWSFNTETKVNRMDFWITFVMMIALIFVFYFINALLFDLLPNSNFWTYCLFGEIFCCTVAFWISFVIFIIRRLKDAQISSWWKYPLIFTGISPIFLVIFSYALKGETPQLLAIVIYYVFPFNPFQLPMFVLLLFCLLPSKAKDSPLP